MKTFLSYFFVALFNLQRLLSGWWSPMPWHSTILSVRVFRKTLPISRLSMPLAYVTLDRPKMNERERERSSVKHSNNTNISYYFVKTLCCKCSIGCREWSKRRANNELKTWVCYTWTTYEYHDVAFSAWLLLLLSPLLFFVVVISMYCR